VLFFLSIVMLWPECGEVRLGVKARQDLAMMWRSDACHGEGRFFLLEFYEMTLSWKNFSLEIFMHKMRKKTSKCMPKQ
jgi:hypothetical protein